MRLSRRAIAFLVPAFAVFVLFNGATADDVTTTAGKKLTGTLVSVDEKGISFSTKEAKVDIPSPDIVVVDFGRPVPPLKDGTPYSEIELTDGSTIRCAKFAIKAKKFDAEQLSGPAGLTAPTFDIPVRTVFSAMKKAEDPKFREAWKKMLVTRGKRDLYVIQQEAGLNFYQGTILEGVQDKDNNWMVNFELESSGKAEELRQSRAAGFVFYQPQPATIAPTICRVLDVYGNALNATAISISPSGVTVTTVAGATVKYPSTASLSKLDYALGNVAYLSALDPKVDRPELPEIETKLNPAIAFLKDRSLSNDSIKLDNAVFQHGICVAPDTVLTYNLGANDYAQFKATVGIDENGSNATSTAKLTIEGDGQVLFTGTLSRKDKPKGLVLAIKGVKQIKVIVEAETPLNGNWVTLADARVQK